MVSPARTNLHGRTKDIGAEIVDGHSPIDRPFDQATVVRGDSLRRSRAPVVQVSTIDLRCGIQLLHPANQLSFGSCEGDGVMKCGHGKLVCILDCKLNCRKMGAKCFA